MVRYPLSVYVAVPAILGTIVLLVLCTSAIAHLRGFLRHGGPVCRFWWHYTASWRWLHRQPWTIDLPSAQRRDPEIFRDAVRPGERPHLTKQIVSPSARRERPVQPWGVR